MLIPRYTIRWLLGLTTFCAAGSLVLAAAVRGEAWAIGVAVGLGSLVLLALLHMGAFLMAWSISRIGSVSTSQRATAGASPFAPPIVPPVASTEDPQALTG